MTQDAKKVLLVPTSHDDLGGLRSTGYYIDEAAHPRKVFMKAGYQVDFASIQVGVAPQDGRQEGDTEQRAFLNHPDVSRRLASTPVLADVDARSYDAVLYVGGHGSMWDFPGSEGVSRVGREIYEGGGVVAAVCHSPAALVNITDAVGKRRGATVRNLTLPTRRPRFLL